ncbi:flavin reductase family protein [Komagataeibacter sp. FNDCF1]|nr:flavin reductase [Komagataeibacter sp. FNDCF1]MCE2563703.1 flavin reductase family protein [Komagataeibacter sp. FNDCF1]
MSRLGAPFTVITPNGPAGQHGLTVPAITRVSDDPSTVLVCLNRSKRSHAAFLCVGVSHRDQAAGTGAGNYRRYRCQRPPKHGKNSRPLQHGARA